MEGPGPIGILVAVIADSLGADVLVSGLGKDTAYRLPLVADLGIETVNVQKQDLDARVDEFAASDGVSVVFDTTGHRSGVETAVAQVRKGGQIVVVGLPDEPSELFMTPIVRGEVDVNTSFGSTWQDFERVLKLLQNGTIDPSSITDTSFDVDEPGEAFHAFLAGETVKPVFDFARQREN